MTNQDPIENAPDIQSLSIAQESLQALGEAFGNDMYLLADPQWVQYAGSEAWHKGAACKGSGVDDRFFPASPDELSPASELACKDCPVRVCCLQYGLMISEQYGIWGGLTQAARVELKRHWQLFYTEALGVTSPAIEFDRVHGKSKTEAERELVMAQMGTTRWKILAEVFIAGGVYTLQGSTSIKQALSDAIGASPQAISQQITFIAGEKLIEIKYAPGGHFMASLELTEKGREQIQADPRFDQISHKGGLGAGAGTPPPPSGGQPKPPPVGSGSQPLPPAGQTAPANPGSMDGLDQEAEAALQAVAGIVRRLQAEKASLSEQVRVLTQQLETCQEDLALVRPMAMKYEQAQRLFMNTDS